MLVQRLIFFLCLLNQGCYRIFLYAFEGCLFFGLSSTLDTFLIFSQFDLSAIDFPQVWDRLLESQIQT